MDKHEKTLSLLQTICDNIRELSEVDEFIYNLFFHTFQYDLRIIEAISTGQKVDPDEALLFISRALNVDLKTLVQRTIDQLNAEKKLKHGLGTLSSEQKELAKRIASGNSVVDDFKSFDFDKFLDGIDLGELEGNDGRQDRVS